MKKKEYTTGDFSKDLKRAYQKPAPKKKRKVSGTVSGRAMARSLYPNGPFGPGGGNARATAGAAYPIGGNSRSGGKMGGQGTVDISDKQLANTGQWNKKSKKSKEKKTKEKGGKKKVSHVLQESSMCKMCKTSHKAGMHKKAKHSEVKKKR